MTDAYATDDGLKLAKLVAYVDDGRDYTARIVWYMNRSMKNALSPCHQRQRWQREALKLRSRRLSASGGR